MTGREPAVPALRLVPGTTDGDRVDDGLAASMARHPAGKRRESAPEPRRRWWLRIGRRA